MRFKRVIILITAIFFLFAGTSAYADPTPPGTPESTPKNSTSPSPTLPAGGSNGDYTGIISYGAEGESVVRIQIRLRELGFFNFKPTGKFQSMTVDATKKFQMVQVDDNGLPIMSDGTVGVQSMLALFSLNARRGEITAGIPVGEQTPVGTPENGELVPWSEVKTLLQQGTSYKVADYNTGMMFDLVFSGGENHAEMECVNSVDSETFKTVFGGEFSFFKRPVTIMINGRRIAASLQGQPHGIDLVSGNEMAGHVCVFFDGSISHVGSLPDAEHINMVYKAAER